MAEKNNLKSTNEDLQKAIDQMHEDEAILGQYYFFVETNTEL